MDSIHPFLNRVYTNGSQLLSNGKEILKRDWKEIVKFVEAVKFRVMTAYHGYYGPEHGYNRPANWAESKVFSLPERNIPLPESPPKNKPWPWFLDVAANIRGSHFRKKEFDAVENFTDLKNEQGETPIHAATLTQNEECLHRWVFSEGGDINVKDNRGQTPAYWAAYHGNLPMLMKLVNYGADVYGRDSREKSPLRAAVKYGRTDVIDFLMTKKVHLYDRDIRGLTPLQLAAYRADFRTYKQLICYGVDRLETDANGRSAEKILEESYMSRYNKSMFILRLFRSPTPPALGLKDWQIERLSSASRGTYTQF